MAGYSKGICSRESNLDALVVFVLAADAQNLHRIDLGAVADVGAAAGLKVDAGNP